MEIEIVLLEQSIVIGTLYQHDIYFSVHLSLEKLIKSAFKNVWEISYIRRASDFLYHISFLFD